MSRTVARIVMASLLLPAGPAAAETFYSKDGVQLSATARVIDPGAATCRIREERHSAEQYEKLKANHGQPLNVWRVELVAANYSGKALDDLTAYLQVDSAWPPCDNWDGLGNYGKPVVWTGPLISIQDVGSVQPGDERREIEFVLVWHEEEPALGRWDINYEFAAAPPAGGAAAETRPESAGTGRATAAAEAPFAGSGLPAGIRPEDTCPGKEVGTSCWMELEKQPTCYIWMPGRLARALMVTWTGGCSSGLAAGAGTLEWHGRNLDGEVILGGQLQNGRFHGQWTLRLPDGTVSEGPYVDGNENGHWIVRLPDGTVAEGPYVDGKENGHWIVRSPSGFVYEGPYVDGKMHGRWTSDGYVSYDCFSNGDRVDCP